MLVLAAAVCAWRPGSWFLSNSKQILDAAVGTSPLCKAPLRACVVNLLSGLRERGYRKRRGDVRVSYATRCSPERTRRFCSNPAFTKAVSATAHVPPLPVPPLSARDLWRKSKSRTTRFKQHFIEEARIRHPHGATYLNDTHTGSGSAWLPATAGSDADCPDGEACSLSLAARGGAIGFRSHPCDLRRWATPTRPRRRCRRGRSSTALQHCG